MPISLTNRPASLQWGKNALLSAKDDGMQIHYQVDNKLQSAQRAGRKLDSQGIKSVTLIGKGWDLETTWHFWQGFRSPKRNNVITWPELSKKHQKELTDRLLIIDWVRDTINMPAEELGPVTLAQRCVSLIASVTDSFEYKIIKGEELKDKNYMGIYTVGRGSSHAPALLVLDYNPTQDPKAPIFASLVGKGITFDSGGYSLKPTSFMESMKSDMGGAATVAGSLALAITRGLKKRVKLFICCADNMVSGDAFRLGDIIHYRNGKTVEVTNTDAEGRLVLADGLIDAEHDNPGWILDCATLTGAAKIAVGNDYHSLLTFDDQLAGKLFTSAAEENEPFWRLPLAEFHRSQIPSPFADLNNSGSANTAGASTAAAFLSYFLKNYQKNWLHIDCSATYRKSAVDLWATGATGIGVRTIANLLLSK
ncbi:aminopeptidase PepB [Zophobihabitans entericus]|uniref:Aminopeptidase PepB n=1 Tax=Zophobihabitans entericus TaxID=1635327 RepID=A0A6G9IEX4_9GAMM|nr:aminopeptidase PepB [Zophobihabitans entericus]